MRGETRGFQGCNPKQTPETFINRCAKCHLRVLFGFSPPGNGLRQLRDCELAIPTRNLLETPRHQTC